MVCPDKFQKWRDTRGMGGGGSCGQTLMWINEACIVAEEIMLSEVKRTIMF